MIYAAEKLSNKRRKIAKALDKAVMAELPPLKLERARFETHIETDAGKPGRFGHRPHRVHGGRQSRHAAGAADEGGVGRRIGALHAGAEGDPRIQGFGADADL